MVKKLAFATADRYNQVQTILPHEIAHQWWPMTVFIDDRDAAFLSEGMCEYSALLFGRARGLLTPRDSLAKHPLLRPLLIRAKKGRDLPLEQKADLRSLPTHYLKALYVHSMLAQIIGEAASGHLYAEYANRYALKHANREDFSRLAEEISGKKLGWFFNQWVLSKGIPRVKIYNVKSSESSTEGWMTTGRVRIVGYEKFTALAEVGVQTAKGMEKGEVWLGADTTGNYRNDVPFQIFTAEKPHRAVLDPEGNLLKFQKLPEKFSDLREPADGVMIVGTLKYAEHLLRLARSDSIEIAKTGWSVQVKFDTAVTLSDLQGERVFVYGSSKENRTAADLEKWFSIGFRGDSIYTGKESVFDSTLSLLQIIGNPFSEDGLLSWIVPLSEKAEPSLLPYESSWSIVRGKKEVYSGIWEVKDEDLEVEIK